MSVGGEDLERRKVSGERGEEGTGGTVVEQSIDVTRGSNQNSEKNTRHKGYIYMSFLQYVQLNHGILY